MRLVFAGPGVRRGLYNRGTMSSTLVAVLVVTLLAPGLVLVFAVVVRLFLRGAPRAPRPPDEREPSDPQP